MITRSFFIGVGGLLGAAILITSFERPPMATEQIGYRGTGMEQVVNPRLIKGLAELHAMPAAAMPPVGDDGPKASETFQNVQVLGDLSVAQFTRLMVNITAWVSPVEGCNYCHKPGEPLNLDTLYQKRVARQMLAMTRNINDDWSAHVGQTGVTCYTCHRGQHVPEYVLTDHPGQPPLAKNAGITYGQNEPSPLSVWTTLPVKAPLLASAEQPIRVQANNALPIEGQTGSTIRQTEATYGLMMYFSDTLGVNCTFCHNSRAFGSWEQSPPQRTTAWHGIQMSRALNEAYLLPLASELPPERLGVAGDAPKVGCGTCHQGVSKPLMGAAVLEAHPELRTAAR